MTSFRAGRLLPAFTTTILLAVVAAGALASPSSADPPPGGFVAVPRATCGPGDRPEPNAQGDQEEPLRTQHYQCNTALRSQVIDGGALVGLAWSDQCAYVGTNFLPIDPRRGTAVLDVSNPSAPVTVRRLQTQVMTSPAESMRENEARGLLGAVLGPAGIAATPELNLGILGDGGNQVELWDIGTDCTAPQRRSTLQVPGFVGHEGNFSPDGNTYWAIDHSTAVDASQHNATRPGAVVVLDVTNPSAPTRLVDLPWPAAFSGMVTNYHSVSFSPDGNHAYFSMIEGGLAIYDVSEIQARAPQPQAHLVGHLTWPDRGSISAHATPATIGGRPYVLVTDEAAPSAGGCSEGRPAYGALHLIDVEDPTHPVEASEIRLEVSLPDGPHCDPLTQLTRYPTSFLSYNPHYCTVDDPANTTAVACGWEVSGLRVEDIRDPFNPREIAYFNPAPKPTSIEGNLFFRTLLSRVNQAFTGSRPRWVEQPDGSWQLWVLSMDNGFMVVDLTHDVYPLPALDPLTPAGATGPGADPASPGDAGERGGPLELPLTGWNATLGWTAILLAAALGGRRVARPVAGAG